MTGHSRFCALGGAVTKLCLALLSCHIGMDLPGWALCFELSYPGPLRSSFLGWVWLDCVSIEALTRAIDEIKVS